MLLKKHIMKGSLLCFVLTLQIVSWVSVARRPFPPTDGMSHPGSKEALAPTNNAKESDQVYMVRESKSQEMKEASVSKIGSSPPSCEHKCYGCTPCEATQVPSNRKRAHLGIQYANYEPESWKCKCGPSLYGP